MDEEIESVFEGNEVEETEVEEVTQEEETETEETKDDEAEGDTAETPAAKEEQDEPWTKKAYLDEKRKRQEAEEKLAKFEQQEKEVVPDPVEDPQGYAKYLEGKQDRSSLALKINLSRDMMLSLDAYKADYEELEGHFIEMAAKNPALAVQMNASPNPAKFAYDTAKEDREIQKLKDPKYLEKLEAEITERVLKQLSDPDKRKAIVKLPDLTTATAKGSNTTPVPKLPELSEMFGDSPF